MVLFSCAFYELFVSQIQITHILSILHLEPPPFHSPSDTSRATPRFFGNVQFSYFLSYMSLVCACASMTMALDIISSTDMFILEFHTWKHIRYIECDADRNLVVRRYLAQSVTHPTTVLHPSTYHHTLCSITSLCEWMHTGKKILSIPLNCMDSMWNSIPKSNHKSIATVISMFTTCKAIFHQTRLLFIVVVANVSAAVSRCASVRLYHTSTPPTSLVAHTHIENV